MATNGDSVWHVHKFGGTSVGDATCFRRVRDIVMKARRNGTRLAVVVSAMGGKPKTTDMLIQLTKHAAADDWASVERVMGDIRAKHETCLVDLFGRDSPACKELTDVVEADLDNIVRLLEAVRVIREAHESIVGVVSGYGEQWSTKFLMYLLAQGEPEQWCYLDARRVLKVHSGGTSDVAICWDDSSARLQEYLKTEAKPGIVITGFIASTQSGGSTTLGRDGSDFSASVFGRLLQAEEITIWTDVTGVLSADPRKVSDAFPLGYVSYREAAELAYFGAKVVHPKTMMPALKRTDWDENAKSIPIYIKNTFAPEAQGTKIFESEAAPVEREDIVVCGFTTVDNMSLISVEGMGMQGCPGVASRLFIALHHAGISVVLIAQASSEQSICYLVEQKDADRAAKATTEAFTREIDTGDIEAVVKTESCSVVAAVGDAMPQTTGVAGKFFGALAQAGVNVLAIAQGQNQRNISAVVKTAESVRALQVLHAAFLTVVPMSVGIIGAGNIAEELLKRIGAQAPVLKERAGLDIRVVAICDPVDRSSRSWQGHPERRGRVALAKNGERLDPNTVLSHFAEHAPHEEVECVRMFTERMMASPLVHKLVVDCSDSADVASSYPEWLDCGMHVVSQNYVGYMAVADRAMRGESIGDCNGEAAKEGGPRLLANAAVGRGLPLLSSWSVMHDSGDVITRIDGVFSVSLHFVCSKVSPADGAAPVPFDEAVRLATNLGYFEEQSMMDLDGHQARMQLSILAHEVADGFAGIYNGSCRHPKVTAEGLSAESFAKVAAEAKVQDKVLRYIGEFDARTMKGVVRPVLVERSHPFAQLPPGSRMARFFTQRRGENSPVVVSGPIGFQLVSDALLADCLVLAGSFGAKKVRVNPVEDPNSERLYKIRRTQSSSEVTDIRRSP